MASTLQAYMHFNKTDLSVSDCHNLIVNELPVTTMMRSKTAVSEITLLHRFVSSYTWIRNQDIYFAVIMYNIRNYINEPYILTVTQYFLLQFMRIYICNVEIFTISRTRQFTKGSSEIFARGQSHSMKDYTETPVIAFDQVGQLFIFIEHFIPKNIVFIPLKCIV